MFLVSNMGCIFNKYRGKMGVRGKNEKRYFWLDFFGIWHTYSVLQIMKGLSLPFPKLNP